MKKLSLLFMAVVCAAGMAMAQRPVSGQVTDEQGDPLIGANVVVKGTSVGTVTDFDGNFSVIVPDGAEVLVVSYTGYAAKEIVIGDQSVFMVQLEAGTLLGEIIVTGYGVQNRRDLTGSISQVKGDEIANLISPSFESLLAGRAAGVQITTPSGIIGSRPIVRIRGVNSITNSASPLYVIDDVPVVVSDRSGIQTSNPLANINPQDIESFEVLKDGSATAIYGSAAANGVILITTKRGREGAAKVSYGLTIGHSSASKRFDLLNASEFVTIANEKRTNANNTPLAMGSSVNTDWQDYILVSAWQQQHNLSISGGSQSTKYFVSLSFSDQNGIIRANEMSRYGFRANLDHSISSRIRVGTSASYSFTELNGLNNGANALSGATGSMHIMHPNVPIFDPNNTEYNGFNISADGQALGPWENLATVDNNRPNIAYVLEHNIYRTRINRLMANVFGELDVISGLTLRTQIGTDGTMSDDFLVWNPNHGDGKGRGGFVQHAYRPAYRWNWLNTATLNKSFANDHNFNVVLGAQYQKSTFYNFTSSAQEFSDEFFTRNNLLSGSFGDQQFVGGGLAEIGSDSYFGRLNYNYRGKYLLTFSARNDGISSLHVDNRRGTFFGGSVGWRIAAEDFFNVEGIDDLKLRASYAQVGNVEIGAYPYAGGYSPVLYGTQAGIALNRIDNSGIRWEASTKTNLGIDLTSGNFDLSLDFFKNDVDDLILDAPVPLSLGVPGSTITQNIGSLVNKGIEAVISTNVLSSGKFSWRTSVNFALMSNEVTSLVDPISVSSNRSGQNRTEEGRSIAEHYVFDWVGVNSANGNPMYRKADGTIVQYNLVPGATGWRIYDSSNPGNVETSATGPSADDLVYAGKSLPTFMGGWNNRFSFGNFDLEILVRGSGGNYIYNETFRSQLGQGFSNNNRAILDRWTEDNTQGSVPKLYTGTDGFANLGSTRFIEKGDFLRVQNVMLSYRVPRASLARILNGGISDLRFFVQAQNLLTITGYSGLDPELNFSGSQLEHGVDWNVTPLPRTFSVGLNVDF